MKRIRIKKRDIINDFHKVKKNIIYYVKHNRLFLSYLFLTFINSFLIRVLTVGNWYNVKTLFIDFGVALFFGSFAYLFKANKQFNYLVILLGINTFICIANALYYAWYSSFASVTLLSTLGQIKTVTDAVFDNLHIIEFVYLIPFILFVYINSRLNKKDYFSFIRKIEKGKKMFIATIICASVIVSYNMVRISPGSYSSLTKQWNRESIVKSFGIVIFQGNDIFQALGSQVNSLFGYDEAAREFTLYYNEKDYTKKKNNYTNMFKDKNVIMIHLESMMTFFVDLKINGVEITPTLNKLVKEGLYFDNFYPQISVGTSSDTEFTVNTSLLPASSGTVFVSYYNREYETLETLLKEKGYYTFSMHGNKSTMWNRDKMHPNLGYDELYFEDKYDIDDVVGLGLSDESFYKQIIPILTEIEKNNKNYMGTIITLSNHTPFNDLEKYPELDLTYKAKVLNSETGQYEEVVYDYLTDRKLGNYIKSAHYADIALGHFIDYIYDNNIMNNTVFVMYGDHDAKLARSEFDYYYNFNPATGDIRETDDPDYYDYDYYENELNRKTPLIIWSKNKKLKTKISYPIGMIDVLPTIANMLGIEPKYALGNDIFNKKWDNIVSFPNGNFLTKKVYYNASKEEYKPIDNEPFDDEYITYCKSYTENIVELSNNIIVYDLIRNEKGRLEFNEK